MKSFSEIVVLVEAKKQGASWRARCRAHGGDDPDTLSLSEGTDGRTLFKCFKGCGPEDILRAYGLEWSDVQPERGREKKQERRTSWLIRNPKGAVVAEHIRFDELGGKKRFIWVRNGRNGLDGMPATKLPLYKSETLIGQPELTHVVVTEGEKACDAAIKLGLLAVGTVCGAAATPSSESLEPLVSKRVTLWPDHDEAGIEHMVRIAEALRGLAEVRWIFIPDAKPKADAADFRGTLDDLRKMVSAEPPVLMGPMVSFEHSLAMAKAELKRIEDNDLTDFVPTGIPRLDEKLSGGFRRGTVTLIGAPSGAGKTSLVVQFAMAAQRRGIAIICSPEMSPQELVTREIVRRSGHPKWHRSVWASPRTRERASIAHDAAALAIEREKPRVLVYDAMHVKLSDVVDAARAFHKHDPIAFIALDYAQDLADIDNQKRHIAVGDVVKVGLELARELHCAVLVTSQVNVFKEGREKSYSFRESQIMEHKASTALIFIVHRDQAGEVTGATFKVRKARDIGYFELDVEYVPELFTIRDKNAPREVHLNEEGDYDPI